MRKERNALAATLRKHDQMHKQAPVVSHHAAAGALLQEQALGCENPAKAAEHCSTKQRGSVSKCSSAAASPLRDHGNVMHLRNAENNVTTWQHSSSQHGQSVIDENCSVSTGAVTPQTTQLAAADVMDEPQRQSALPSIINSEICVAAGCKSPKLNDMISRLQHLQEIAESLLA